MKAMGTKPLPRIASSAEWEATGPHPHASSRRPLGKARNASARAKVGKTGEAMSKQRTSAQRSVLRRYGSPRSREGGRPRSLPVLEENYERYVVRHQ